MAISSLVLVRQIVSSMKPREASWCTSLRGKPSLSSLVPREPNLYPLPPTCSQRCRGSMYIMKRRGLSGSPWIVPRVTVIGSVLPVGRDTVVLCPV